MRGITAALYQVPTERPEADGTLAWDHTTMLLVEIAGSDGARGLGFSYTGAGAEALVRDPLSAAVRDLDDDEIGACWSAMLAAVRDAGRPGLAACAISAVDIALWDLRARRWGVPLFRLLPTYRRSVPIYGSGGFTPDWKRCCSTERLGHWATGWLQTRIGAGGQRLGRKRPELAVHPVMRRRVRLVDSSPACSHADCDPAASSIEEPFPAVRVRAISARGM